MCGTPKVSRSWEPLWGILSFCLLSSSSGWVEERKLWGRHPFSARPAMCMAAPPPMRRSALPPLVADRASQSIIRQGHDAGMQRAMEVLLGSLPGDDAQVEMARHITTLLLRMGRIGSAIGAEDGASSFLGFVGGCIARRVLHVLEGPAFGCLGELQEATERLDRCGFVDRPNWEALRRGLRPRPPAAAVEPGEWQHGWQYYASSSLEHHYRETEVLAQSCAADQAHLRSHSGPCASLVLCGCPTSPEFEVKPHIFRTVVLERLRLPLMITEARCECRRALDVRGQHRAACPQSGRLRSRAVPTERTLARVCREAGRLSEDQHQVA